MGFFNRRKIADSPNRIMAEALKYRKKLQFDLDVFSDLVSSMEQDVEYLAQLKPANYYKSNPHLVQANFFYDKEYKSVYVMFEEFKGEKVIASSDYFEINEALLRASLAKFGQRL